jgi:ribonuclease P protein subunit RPR2
MSQAHAKRKKLFKTIANHRIHSLMHLAETTALQGHYSYANRYVALARKIAMRYLIPIPAEYKRHICKNCYAYLLPGQNAHIRIHRGKIITKCHTCHHINRHPVYPKHR